MQPAFSSPRGVRRAVACLLLLFATSIGVLGQAPVTTPYPVLFVTQTPLTSDFATSTAVLGNQPASVYAAPRGGDLWIRYTDGTLKNLTAAAGLGHDGLQNASSIAVRDPAVHWSGTKALFSMVVGAPAQYQTPVYRWQIYEIVGLGVADSPVVTLVPHQPSGFDNVAPTYGTDDRVLFVSDRPRNAEPHLFPLRDEYESTASPTGLWSVDPISGDLRQLTHAPSGDFKPFVDSFGRVVFTRWDHLQRDQQADGEALGTTGPWGSYNWSGEAAGAPALATNVEVFPEPRPSRVDLLQGTPYLGHVFNHFLPWQVNEDGSDLETLNHVARHELHNYFERARGDDPALVTFQAALSGRPNPRSIQNFLHIAEDPLVPGTYYGVDCNEFGTHASGQIVRMSLPPTLNPDDVIVDYVTHRDTVFIDTTPSADHSGHYRDPRPLSDGTLIASHATATGFGGNLGTTALPQPTHQFRLRKLAPSGVHQAAAEHLTGGIVKTLSWWSPDVFVSYSGQMWELQPVEVRARPRPARRVSSIAPPELAAFAAAEVLPLELMAWLAAENLALIVARDITTRDDADRQQPFNLKIAGAGHQTVGTPGVVYETTGMQVFQGDHLRAYSAFASSSAGRRVLAVPQHDGVQHNLPAPGLPPGSLPAFPDGSVAGFVPARRALTWQLIEPTGEGLVRERNWLSFAPGEVRTCTSCHAPNRFDQAGQAPPENTPIALTALLTQWKTARLAEASQSLGAAGAGTIGVATGGPFDVLTVNGSAGLPARRVDLSAGASFGLAVLPPPGFASSPFALFGVLGVPSPATAYVPPFTPPEGTFLFTPPFAAAAAPWTFTLANGLWVDPTALLPGGTAPWNVTIGGLPPLTFTLQGLMIDGAWPDPFGFTNAVVVRIQ